MKTAGALSDRTKKDLADMARSKGVRGFARMDRDALIQALNRLTAKPGAAPAPRPAAKPLPRPAAKSAAKVTRPAKPVPASKSTINGSHRAAPPAARMPTPPPATKPASKSASTPVAAKSAAPVAGKPPAPVVKALIKTNAPPPAAIPAAKDLSAAHAGATKDRILLMVPDPFWLHAYWELTHQSVQRAEAALKQDWYGAKPVIRLFDVTSTDTTSTSETPVRDIFVHGECNNWYIDIPQPPR
jgi:hypothetical protein